MEEYVSYHKIIQLIEDYQISQEGIGLNSFGHGNIVEFGASPSGNTPTYPFLFATPISVSYDENITTWTIQLIFADRINDDLSNEIDVISDMSIQAKRFMSYIKRGFNQTPDLYNRLDCNLPVTAQPIMERFNDFIGGVALDIEIIVFEDINACDYYAPLPSPTPSNTASPTPTITPTITPTPTDSRACRTYRIQSSCCFSNTFNWTNCDGTPGSLSGSVSVPATDICAKQGSVSQSGGGTITDIGSC